MNNEDNYDYQYPVHVSNGPEIDIHLLVHTLPYELLVKIYNEYFRPVKYYQLYQSITTDTMYSDYDAFLVNKDIFGQHLQIFVFQNIRQYIQKKDNIFTFMWNDLHKRGYTSIFRMIPNIKSGVFLEILMRKYH
jgi:hypothetical protein